MAANTPSAPEAPDSKKAPDPKTAISDLAALFVAMNRVTDRLQKAAQGANIHQSLTDWLLLQTLAAEGPQPMSKAAFKIGVTRQRIHQQAGPLESAGLVTTSPGDGKTKVLEITAAGRHLATLLEKEFLKSITTESGELAAGPVRTAKGGAVRLARAIMLKAKAGEPAKE